MQVFKYICLGIILGIGLSWGWSSYTTHKAETIQPSIPAVASVSRQQTPFAVIYNFYQALGEGREDQIALLVTPDFLSSLNSNHHLYKWHLRRQEDPSLRFVFFLINEQEIDFNAGTARVKGSAEWVSASKGALSVPQTIIILNQQGKWKIKSIEEKV